MRSIKSISYPLLFFVFISITSCKTKVTASGTVYSKHHIPVEGATVRFNYSVGGKSQVQGGVSKVTDENGQFIFSKESTNRRNSSIVSVSIFHSDSGTLNLESSKFQLGPNMEFQLR